MLREGWGVFMLKRRSQCGQYEEIETDVNDEPKQVNRMRTIELPDWDSPGDKLNIIVGHFIWI